MNNMRWTPLPSFCLWRRGGTKYRVSLNGAGAQTAVVRQQNRSDSDKTATSVRGQAQPDTPVFFYFASCGTCLSAQCRDLTTDNTFAAEYP